MRALDLAAPHEALLKAIWIKGTAELVVTTSRVWGGRRWLVWRPWLPGLGRLERPCRNRCTHVRSMCQWLLLLLALRTSCCSGRVALKGPHAREPRLHVAQRQRQQQLSPVLPTLCCCPS